MRTKKPIATISYNTREFLLKRLEELRSEGKICDYMCIRHRREEDEKKDHWHVYIEPNTLLDTMDLQNRFKEVDFEGGGLPLGVINFRSSKIDDWILYCMHYPPYLATKGESREYTYSKEDFIYMDEMTFEDSYYHALKGSDWAKRYELLQQLNDGKINPSELILNGTVPLQMASQLNALNYMRTHWGTTTRGDHENHEKKEEVKKELKSTQEVFEETADSMSLKQTEKMIDFYNNQIEFLQKKIDEEMKKRYNQEGF